MLQSALDGLYDIVDARPGDKTIVDTLYPASQYLNKAASENVAFDEALDQMKDIAQKGMESTKGEGESLPLHSIYSSFATEGID